MAKNKGIKWMVGLSSVAVFTGFVGLSQKYDQTSNTSGAYQNNGNDGSYFSNDQSQFGSSSNNGAFRGGFSRHGGFGNNGSENSDNNQIRGHAS